MDEGLRTIQLNPNWIGAVQAGCRTLVGLVLRNEGYIHSESLISTPLNLTLNRLPLQPNSDIGLDRADRHYCRWTYSFS